MILTRDGKEITTIYRQDGSEIEEVKDANGRIVYLASREITGTLPFSFTSRGKPLTDYLISGNILQNGTPSPEAPVDVVGCGVWDETRQSYKLPLTVNGTEYPIYLGQTQTTRRIKKLVLDGTETGWNVTTSNTESGTYVFSIRYDAIGMGDIVNYDEIMTKIPYPQFYSTQFKLKSNILANNDYRDIKSGEIGANNVVLGSVHYNRYIIFATNQCSTVIDFTQFLAAQYANGTPVTVWYVLTTEETGIVNEPLMKIGDHSDTISMTQAGVTIPTVNGANVLDMTSPVKPSEVYIKGKGIKQNGG